MKTISFTFFLLASLLILLTHCRTFGETVEIRVPQERVSLVSKSILDSEDYSRPQMPWIRERDYVYPTPSIEYPDRPTSTPRNFWRNYEFRERREWNINQRIINSPAYRKEFVYKQSRGNCFPRK